MATYSTIKGFTIQSLATDPVATTIAGGTWASGGNLNQARTELAGAGTQTAALAFGGQLPPYSKLTESYDGTTWTEVNDLQTARRMPGGAGTQAAALCFAGRDPGNNYSSYSEEYDGTSWAEGNNTPGTTSEMRGCGTQTAALGVGGYNGSAQTITYEYDGTCWSNGGSLGTARYSSGVAGTQTAAIDASGAPAYSAETEIYDGTTWTSLGTILNTGRQGPGCGGIQTAALLASGEGPPVPGYSSGTEAFDGTTWTVLPATVATARYNCGSAIGATQATTTIFGGYGPGSPANATEEFSIPSTVSLAQEGQVWYNTASAVLKGFGSQGTGAWASGGTMNSPHLSSGGYCGTQTAGVYAGGIPGDVTTTQTYNGLAWSASPATLNVGRHYLASTGIGVQTAAMLFGGELPSPPHDSNSSEEFDGSTWTATPAINTARGAIAGAGTATAGLGATGNLDGGGASNKTESWNGSTWTEVNDHNNSIKYVMGGGTQTSAFTAGGAPSPMEATSSQWDGTSWSSDATINTGRNDGSRGAASGTAALIFSGNDAPSRGAAESFNGTAWTTEASLATARQAAAGSGTSMLSLAVGGAPIPVGLGYTEEWTIPDAIKTFTAS